MSVSQTEPSGSQAQQLQAPLLHDDDVEANEPGHEISMEVSLSCGKQLCELVKLGVPIFITMVAFVAMIVTDTALIGHTGTLYLDAVALQSLWTSSTGVFISACALDVLGAQAYGAGQNEELGIWFQIALFCMAVVVAFVMGTWAVTGPFLSATGAEHNLVWPAWYYALVLGGSLPAKVFSSQINQYFQVQRIMLPSTVAAIVAVVLNLFFGLVLVLGIPFDLNPDPNQKGYGFWVCPMITTTMEYVQLLILGIVFLRHKDESWPGFRCAHIFSKAANGTARLWTFIKLWFPLALSLASDYWRVSVIGIVAAGLGSDELGVFNASYRILWICITLAGALASATGISLGNVLGKGRAGDARFVSYVGLVTIFAVLMVLATGVVSFSRELGSIFTSDEHVLDMFQEIRWPLAVTTVLMNFSVAIERIPSTMGKARVVLITGLIGSWVGQVPGVFIAVNFWRRDLVGLYTGMAAGYGLLCLLFVVFISRVSWVQVTKDVLKTHQK